MKPRLSLPQSLRCARCSVGSGLRRPAAALRPASWKPNSAGTPAATPSCARAHKTDETDSKRKSMSCPVVPCSATRHALHRLCKVRGLTTDWIAWSAAFASCCSPASCVCSASDCVLRLAACSKSSASAALASAACKRRSSSTGKPRCLQFRGSAPLSECLLTAPTLNMQRIQVHAIHQVSAALNHA